MQNKEQYISHMYSLFAVPTSVSTFSSSVTAIVTSPFLFPTTVTNPPPLTINAQSSTPVAVGVTVPLLFLLIVLIAVIVGLLWVKKRRRMKATADRTIPLQILPW